ncbi:hypothetical protein TNCV_1186391 [Trichonephila clavipes]|nr:hypothetical protein TNCV_1186391 [Trichonephila clavipes]
MAAIHHCHWWWWCVCVGGVQLYNNTHPHLSRVSHKKLVKLKRDQLDHPPYSPYMPPCDFQVFGFPKTTSEREELQHGRRTQRHCEGMGLVTATGILRTRNASARESMESLCPGQWCTHTHMH